MCRGSNLWYLIVDTAVPIFRCAFDIQAVRGRLPPRSRRLTGSRVLLYDLSHPLILWLIPRTRAVKPRPVIALPCLVTIIQAHQRRRYNPIQLLTDPNDSDCGARIHLFIADMLSRPSAP